MNLIDKVLNERYKVTEKIDEGGMAIVYKSTDLLLVRTVAIKVLKDRFAKNKNVLERFYREARSAGSLSHPNIVSVYDIGREEDFYFIVMEYMGNGTLEELIEDQKVLSPQEVIRFGIQICQALMYSHQKGVIHRDIKARNVMLTAENQAKVVDFGIARAIDAREITEKGLIMGSAYYFSPEQASGKAVTESSDIYSLGVLLYYISAGRHPFEGNSFAELVRKHIKEQPKPPSKLNSRIPLELERIILRAMEKKIQDRFSSVEDMLKALKNCSNLFDEACFDEEQTDGGDSIDVFEVEEDSPFFAEEYEKKLQDNYEKGKKDDDDEIIITLDDLRDRHKSQKLGKFLPVILIILSIVFTGIFIGVILAITKPPPEIPMVVVPDIKGRKEIQAKKILETWGLSLGEIKKEYNYDYAADTIISQSPSEGERVRRGDKVSIVLSLGARKVVVPNLIQKNIKDAQILLNQKGLLLEILREEYHEELNPNYVISQEPPAGTEVEGKTTVRIVISRGKEGIIVPDLSNLTQSEAASILSIQGLNLIIAGEEISNVKKGMIVSQDPPSGSTVTRDSSIRVIISLGKKVEETPKPDEKVTVPDFTAKTLKEVKSLTETLGLKITVETEEEKITDDMIIYYQSPMADEKLNRGEEILVKVKKKVTVVEVPDVTGKLLMDAKNALSRKGLLIGDKAYSMTNEVPPDTVIKQDPSPKTLLPTGSTVALTIAKPEDRTMETVPNLVGMTLFQAQEELEKCELSLGELISQPSAEKSGTVLSQFPLSGELVKKGTGIDLILSE